MGKTPFHTQHSGVSLATSTPVSLSNGTSLKIFVIAHPRHLGWWSKVGDLEAKGGVGAAPQHSDSLNIHSSNNIPHICSTFSLLFFFSLFNFQLMNCSPELLYYY